MSMEVMSDLASAPSQAIRSREVLMNERKFPEILRYVTVIHNRKHRRVETLVSRKIRIKFYIRLRNFW